MTGPWRMRFIIVLASMLALPLQAREETGFPSGTSYEVCSMIASQYLTTIQLLQKGFAPQILKKTLPGLTDQGAHRIDSLQQQVERSGVTETYSGVNARYARCASQVHEQRGQPKPGTRQHHFYVCAGENKVRYEILLAALAGGQLEEIREQLAPPHRKAASRIFQRLRESDVETVFSELASELKVCLKQDPAG